MMVHRCPVPLFLVYPTIMKTISITLLVVCCLLVAVAQATDSLDQVSNVAGQYNRDHKHHYVGEEEKNEMVETLVDRASELMENVTEALEKCRSEGRVRLASSLDQESIVMEALMKDLQSTDANPEGEEALHHLHLLEEELLYHENRVAEELQALEGGDDVTAPDHKHNVHHLVRRAQHLIERAGKVIEAHRTHGHRELRALQHEVNQIEKLLAHLVKHQHSDELGRAAEQLGRHERSLIQLIQRVKYHHRHDNDHPQGH